jgi:hypothetical protein
MVKDVNRSQTEAKWAEIRTYLREVVRSNIFLVIHRGWLCPPHQTAVDDTVLVFKFLRTSEIGEIAILATDDKIHRQIPDANFACHAWLNRRF